MSTDLDAIPPKLFYKQSEVCQLTDTQPYVLRFWESEFPQLAPEKNRSGQRIYRREDLALVLKIKKLLNDEEYTIAGARRRLEEEAAGIVPSPAPSAPEPVRQEAAAPPERSSKPAARPLPLDTPASEPTPIDDTQRAALARTEAALGAANAEREALKSRIRLARERLELALRQIEDRRDPS